MAAVGAVALAPATAGAQAHTSSSVALVRQAPAAGSITVAGAARLVASVNALLTRGTPMSLTATLEPLALSSGGSVGIAVIELGGSSPIVWSYNGGTVFIAASTYKLVALMMEAQSIASGATDPSGYVCYTADDYEAGWFDDYTDGMCLTRTELAQRAGLFSDNTAGHMLVRDVGGADALNAWAASHGASSSTFFTDNTTSPSDLARLWSEEATGALGGPAAQAWLYPVLAGSTTESGIPAGVAGRSTVVHKTGQIDTEVNDAALVVSGPKGAYVLTVMTDGIGGDAAWQLIASLSADVWTFESTRG